MATGNRNLRAFEQFLNLPFDGQGGADLGDAARALGTALQSGQQITNPEQFLRSFMNASVNKQQFNQQQAKRSPLAKALLGKPAFSNPLATATRAGGGLGRRPPIQNFFPVPGRPGFGTPPSFGTPPGQTNLGNLFGGQGGQNLEDLIDSLFGGGASDGDDGTSNVVRDIEEQGRNRQRRLREQFGKDKERLLSNFASRGVLSSGGARDAEVDLLSNLFLALGGAETDIQRAVSDALLSQNRFDRTQGLAERQADLNFLRSLFDLFGVSPVGGVTTPTATSGVAPPSNFPSVNVVSQVPPPQVLTGGTPPAVSRGAVPPPPTSAALSPNEKLNREVSRQQDFPFGFGANTGGLDQPGPSPPEVRQRIEMAQEAARIVLDIEAREFGRGRRRTREQIARSLGLPVPVETVLAVAQEMRPEPKGLRGFGGFVGSINPEFRFRGSPQSLPPIATRPGAFGQVLVDPRPRDNPFT